MVNIENARNFGLLRKQKLIVYMSRPQNSFLIQPQLQDSLAQPQKGQNDPQIGQNEKGKINKCLENIFLMNGETPKMFSDLTSPPK